VVQDLQVDLQVVINIVEFQFLKYSTFLTRI